MEILGEVRTLEYPKYAVTPDGKAAKVGDGRAHAMGLIVIFRGKY